jgi:hypothetical protein
LNGAMYSKLSWRSCALCSPCVTWRSFGWCPVVLYSCWWLEVLFVHTVWGLPNDQSCVTGVNGPSLLNSKLNLDRMAVALCDTRDWPGGNARYQIYTRVALSVRRSASAGNARFQKETRPSFSRTATC